MCQQWQTGIYNESKCAECPFEVIPVKELPVLNISENAADETWKECQFVDPSDDCTFYFLYYYDGRNNLTVWVKEEKDCPAPLPVLVIVLIVIAGIVILGLLLLCLWKILTMIYDRREYAKFEKERLNARWEAVSFTLRLRCEITTCILERKSNLQTSYNNIQKSCLCRRCPQK